MININTDYLPEQERRQAEYLAALATYHEAQSAFIRDMQLHGQANMTQVNQLGQRVLELEPNWLETASAVDTSEARRRFGVPPATLTWWARTGQVRAEKHGNRWYYCASDVENAVGVGR